MAKPSSPGMLIHGNLYHDPVVVRPFTLVVAGSNASADVKAQADYPCGGENDQVQIQDALDSLTAGRTWQETVKLIGDFSISAQINPDSYTVLDLREANLTLANGADDHMISALDKHYVTILGGILDGNRANNAGNLVGIVFTNAGTNLKIEGTTVRETMGSGIVIGTAEHITITKCHIHDVGDNAFTTHGIYLAGTSYVLISDNIIHDSNQACVGLCTACYRVTIADNLLYDSGAGDPIAGYAAGNEHILAIGNQCHSSSNHGIHLGGNYLTVQDNIIEGTAATGIYIHNDAGTAEDVIVSGNVVRGFTSQGINISVVDKVIVANNYIYAAGAGRLGIQAGTVTYMNIADNIILGDGANNYGCYISNCPRAIISGNQIRGHGTDGIRMTGAASQYGIIVNNQIEGNAAWGYRDVAAADWNYIGHNLFANNVGGDVNPALNTVQHAW